MEARLCFIGHALMENRSGLVVDAELTRASGHAERLAALAMVDRLPTVGRVTLGADRGFDARGLRLELRERRVTPHIAQNTSGRTLGDRRPDHPPCRLCPEPAGEEADRGSLRLDQDECRPGPNQGARASAGALVLHARRRRLQPDPPAQADRSSRLTVMALSTVPIGLERPGRQPDRRVHPAPRLPDCANRTRPQPFFNDLLIVGRRWPSSRHGVQSITTRQGLRHARMASALV